MERGMRALAEQSGQRAAPSIIRKNGRMRAADWGVLAVIGFEIPSLLLSQYRANSIRTSGAIAVASLVYLLVRLIIRTPLRAAWLAGLLGLGGAWLSFVGVRQFFIGMQRLQEAGFTDMVAFRSRLVHPIPGWIPGECFTALLLALPRITLHHLRNLLRSTSRPRP